jgi:hypothetical protein
MLLLASRLLALLIGAVAVLHAWPQGRYAFKVFLQCGIACVLIWFPQAVDDFTFGTTRVGHKIDSHTPAWMIAAMGWILLMLHVIFTLRPRWIGELFGM